MLLFFSTTSLFSSTQTYIMYFEDSVKGLSVGSSVKFKGVPIGQVKKIYISYNQAKTSARIPVLMEIESEQLKQLAELRKVSVSDVLREEVKGGLRAQLQLESFITGLLFVDLNYFPSNIQPEYFAQSDIYPEIPTVRGQFSELGNSANDLFARLNAVDYAGLADSIRNLATSLNRILASVDAKEFGASVQNSAASLDAILKEAREENVARHAAEALVGLGRASQEIGGALQGESAVGLRLYRLLENVSDAAEAVARLTDYLERHPNAILTGRPANE